MVLSYLKPKISSPLAMENFPMMFRRTLTAAVFSLALGTAFAHGHDPLPAQLATDKNLSTFSKLVVVAGLKEALEAAGPFTVFAPNDDAFAKVGKEALEKLAADKEQLKAVLLYHVLGKAVSSTDIKANSKEKTLQGESLEVDAAGTFVTVGNATMKEGAMVLNADIKAKNGVAHVIDRVLMPPPPKK